MTLQKYKKHSDKDAKIDVNDVKDFLSKFPYNQNNTNIGMDNLEVYQLILSKQLQPEQYNGIENFFYITSNQNATSEQIESVLVM